jgi:hypothetical protein
MVTGPWTGLQLQEQSTADRNRAAAVVAELREQG